MDYDGGGADIGRDPGRALGDEPEPAWRDTAPDPLAPIDPTAPVSGHHPSPIEGTAISLSAEHDWSAAAGALMPRLRPIGTAGLRLAEVDPTRLVATSNQAHTLPLLGDGPCGVPVVYVLPSTGFEVIVNGDHLLSWGVAPGEVHAAAVANLARWSAGSEWVREASDDRQLLSSATGEGGDAARILLPEVRAHLAATLGADAGRTVYVGIPEPHLLLAGSAGPDDTEFGTLFAQFIGDYAEGADEPLDRRVFVLRDRELVPVATVAGA
jgi:hypothetical protein